MMELYRSRVSIEVLYSTAYIIRGTKCSDVLKRSTTTMKNSMYADAISRVNLLHNNNNHYKT